MGHGRLPWGCQGPKPAIRSGCRWSVKRVSISATASMFFVVALIVATAGTLLANVAVRQEAGRLVVGESDAVLLTLILLAATVIAYHLPPETA